MKQILAVIKPFLADKVLRALVEAGYDDVIVRAVRGYGRQKSYLSEYKENEYSVAFLPKVEVCVWVEDDQAEQVTRIIVQKARTGRMGDGKIIILPAAAATANCKTAHKK